jgi:hypothetical protein
MTYKITTASNSDGLINCLPQPGLVRNQLFTSMLENSNRLFNLVHPDKSCYRDKVNGVAGRRAVGSVFCSPFIKFTVTSKRRFHYRDSYVRGFYLDVTTSFHLPGPDSYREAKNSPTLTPFANALGRLTATH